MLIRGAVYSGSDIPDISGGIAGINYVVAGNTLDEGVVSKVEEGFLNSDGDLKSKLLAALVAVKDAGIGDNRCTAHGVSSHLAILQAGSYRKFYNSQTVDKDAVEGLAELMSAQ